MRWDPLSTHTTLIIFFLCHSCFTNCALKLVLFLKFLYLKYDDTNAYVVNAGDTT